ncbi:TetR/AcrR family transcriptional regulator [Natronoglycomyces albus]|uniref:TetR family transcriptional regulator n=1 Tax=Natronoglycomyces albus TaxID=2811108 RepID=A0A895XPF1_9ACTN|nr:TetR family transcriptional regulator [Natronoglycomyces albus]QSB05423.1 TetR family transcriptional regulator [Natronoglycomyces albus]
MATSEPDVTARDSTSGVTRRKRGPGDPGRKERIAEAAIRVIDAHGVEALTHRRVAAEAGVPLGSTTYYYKSLDDLLNAALIKATESSIAALREWEASLAEDADLAEALTDFVMDSIGPKRRATLAEYNLYAVALHRPKLRKAAVKWDDAIAGVLARRCDEQTAKMLAVLLCALVLQSVLRDDDLRAEQVYAVLRRAL